MSFGSRLREARKAAGMSQAQLADKVGDYAPHIGNYENGRHIPRWDMVVDLADALGVSLDWLAEREGYGKQVQKKDPPREVWRY